MTPAKIMIIDDDAAVRHIIMAILERKGYELMAAYDVPNAFDVLADEHPDVICCDLMMPVYSGLDFLKRIKDDENLRAIPVIIISASGEQDMIEQAVALGAYATLAKPLSSAQLLETVEAALAGRSLD